AFSIQETDRHAFQLQKLPLLLVVAADHDQRDLQRALLLERLPGGGRDVDAMDAWRVVAAPALVEAPRLRRRDIAMAGTAVAGPMSEDRDVAGVVRIALDRRRGVGPGFVQEGAHEAGAHQLRHLVQADLRAFEAARGL